MSDINLPIKFWNVNTEAQKDFLQIHFPNCEFVNIPHEADILLNPQDLDDPTFPDINASQLFSAYINPSPTYSVLHDHVSSLDFLRAGIKRFKIDFIDHSPYSEFCNTQEYSEFKAANNLLNFHLIYAKYANEIIVGEGTLDELEEQFPAEFNMESMSGVVFPDNGRYFVRISDAKFKQGFTRSYGFGGYSGSSLFNISNIYVPKRIRNAINLMLSPHCGWYMVEFFEEDGIHKIHTIKWGLRDGHMDPWFWSTEAGQMLIGIFNEAVIGGKPMLGYEGELVGHGG